MAKLPSFDLHVVEQVALEVVILEIGTNDLVNTGPEVVGSNIESLVPLLLDSYFVRVIGVCHVIPRGVSHIDSSRFPQRVEILKQYLSVVLESLPNVFCWLHKAFSHPAKDLYLADGVHVNPAGQYHLYRSYRGAIFQALKMLWIFVTSTRVLSFLSSSHRFHINSSVFFFCGFVHKNFYFVRICPLVVDSFICCFVDSRFRPLVLDSSICFVVDSSTQFLICEDSSSCYGFTIFFVVDSSTQFLIWEDSSSCYGFVHFLFCGFVHFYVPFLFGI